MDKLINYIAEIVPVEIIELAAEHVDMFFTYSMKESGVDNDGQSFWGCRTDAGKKLAAVGVAEEAIETGRDYAVMVWLHELSHVICERGHTELFHSMLDQLIIETNSQSGTQIESDYYDLDPELF